MRHPPPPRVSRTGRDGGDGLSAAGTAGALVGTFATGFVLVAALLVTFAEHFDHLALIAPPEATFGNHVLVGSDAPIELDRIDPAAGIAITGEELEAFLGDAQALRDDFAPVDQLISRR